jgi:hypothetical protein
MAKYTAQVDDSSHLTLHFSGPGIARANVALLTECLNVLLECAEKNNCFEKGLSSACISAIAQHNEKCQCLSKAFGFAGVSA